MTTTTPLQHALFRATNPNGGALRDLRGRLADADDDAAHLRALEILHARQDPSGGWAGEKAGPSLDDGTSQYPTLAAIERIAELRARGEPIPDWLYVMALAGVAFLLSAQHASGLFVQAMYEVPADEAYRRHPTLNDMATDLTMAVLRRALEVLGADQGLSWRRVIENAMRRCASTLVRLHRASGGMLYEQYDGGSWKRVNAPPLLPMRGRAHEPAIPSNRASMYAANALLEAWSALDERQWLDAASEIADGLERRVCLIGGATIGTGGVGGGWWSNYYESIRNPVPVYVTPNGDRTPSQLEAHNPDRGWWSHDARATLARVRAAFTTEDAENAEGER